MHKGSIVLIPFPFTDLSGQKIRPAIVVAPLSKTEDCIVVFVSSVKEKSKNVLPIKASSENGLKSDSVIKFTKVATLQKKLIIGEIGILEKSYQKLLTKSLQDLFV